MNTSNWEIEVNRPQRAYARRMARIDYPLVRTPYLWGEGTDIEHWITNFSDHPNYMRSYFKHLRIIRAERFKLEFTHERRS